MRTPKLGLLLVSTLVVCGGLKAAAAQQKESDLDALLVKLRDPSVSNEAKLELLQATKSDPHAKVYVQQRLPALVGSYGGRGNRREDHAWGAAADLTAELRVAGAAPALCQKIDLITNPLIGMSFSYNFLNRGAVKALIRIGQPAVPCVLNTLKSGSPIQREEAAYVLGNIGTDDAHRALEGQQSLEKDPQVRRRIDQALKQQPSNPKRP